MARKIIPMLAESWLYVWEKRLNLITILLYLMPVLDR